jgi:hypothetical protein
MWNFNLFIYLFIYFKINKKLTKAHPNLLPPKKKTIPNYFWAK